MAAANAEDTGRNHTAGNETAKGNLGSIETRIIDGEIIPPESFPWVVPLALRRSATTYSVFCSGVVAGSNQISTAAHCLFDENDPRRYSYDMGLVGIVVERVFYGARNAVHAGWNPETFENDVAVLRVDGNFSYLLNEILINVADPDFSNAGAELAVYGYGITGWGTNIDGQLRTFDTFLNGESICRQYAERLQIEYLPRFELCFGSRNESSRPCVGDSGGGIFGMHNGTRANILVGQTIYGAAECQPSATFASRTSGFSNFFRRNLNVCPCTADRNCMEVTNAPYLCPIPSDSVWHTHSTVGAMTTTCFSALLVLAYFNHIS